MVALLFGIILILVSVYAVIPAFPFGLGWLPEVIIFLKGAAPILALLIGLLAVFIGIADIKDKKEAARENEQEQGTKE